MMRAVFAHGCAGASLLWVVAFSQPASGADPSFLDLKQSRLRPGVLPAWETPSERVQRRASPSPSVLRHPPVAGYRVPAEFEPVSAFLVTQGDWSDSVLWPEIDMLIDMLRKGTAAEGAGALVLSTQPPASYSAFLASRGVDPQRIRVLRPRSGLDAKWARDFGPISVYEQGMVGHLGVVDLHYYDHRPHDDAIGSFLADQLGLDRYGLEGTDHTPPDDAKLYMEGGNFLTDGKGTCIVSNDIPEDNAENGNNEADSIAEVEPLLKAYLGCQKVIWLTPPPGTGTGHVDMYAKLLTPSDVLMIDMPNGLGNNGVADTILEQDVATLAAATGVDGDSFQIHRVTIPSLGGAWTYQTYTNAVMVNRVVMVPTYDDPSYDQPALDVFRNVLGSSYNVVGVPSSTIIEQGGSVHCTTMQIASACGNGRIDDLLFEQCDGQNLGGETCSSLGMTQGELRCDPVRCTLDTSACGEPREAGLDAEAAAEAAADGAVDVRWDSEAVDSAQSGAGQEQAGESTPDGSQAEAPGDEEVAPVDTTRPGAMQAEEGSCGCRQSPSHRSAVWIWVLVGGWRARRRARRSDTGRS
jgi:agmatine deiminase